jgi:hypothetical protein
MVIEGWFSYAMSLRYKLEHYPSQDHLLDFDTLCKDADSAVPALLAAKAEYAKLP